MSKPERIRPSLQTVMVGGDATFACKSGEDVRWEFKGGPIPLNARETGINLQLSKFLLTIHSVQLSNAGTYICIGEDGDHIVFEAIGELIVSSKFFYNICISFSQFLKKANGILIVILA